MEILGLLTIALVAGTIARALYREAIPSDLGPSLLAGCAGVAGAYALSTIGLADMAIGDIAGWFATITLAYVVVAVGDGLLAIARPLRGLDRAG